MFYHVTPQHNLPSILKEGLVPMIGENSALIGETTPAVYLFASIGDCENALQNWLGEQYEDMPEDYLVILEIDQTALPTEQLVEWEHVCYQTIEPKRILRVLDESLQPLAVSA